MRILIAERQPKVRFALRLLLQRWSWGDVVGEATHAQELLPQIEDTHPDLLLLDWSLPGLTQLGTLSALRRVQPRLSVIALGRPEARQAALAAGADAFVSKADPPERLVAAIEHCRREQPTTT